MRLDSKVHGQLIRNRDGQPIPEDEFVVFRPADNALVDTLKFYRAKCAELGADLAQLKAVDSLIERVLLWRQQHPERCKVADVEPGELTNA
jgi:hypothetical protein